MLKGRAQYKPYFPNMPQKDIIPETITKELDAICSSPVFTAAPRMQQLLRFLVNKTLSGQQNQIKAYTIGVEIFARDADFNSQSDPVVRVEMRRLRSKLQSYYTSFPAGEIMINIPKGSYIPEFIPAGSPECLTLTGKNTELFQYAASVAANTSVLVAPFEDISPERDMSRLGIGLAADITAALVEFPGISVAGQYYVRQMIDNGYSIQDLARQTKAGFVISGSVQVQGQSLRLVVELTDTSTGMLLCAQRFTYAYSEEDVFKLQDKITWQVLSHLADYLHLTSNFFQKTPTPLPAATAETYDAILRFSAWESSLNPELLCRARNALESVVDDKNIYPQTAAMLADIYASEYRHGGDHTPDALDKAFALTEKALAKNPDYPIACWTQALYYFLQHDHKRLQQSLQRVISLKANYNNVLSAAAALMITSGDLDKGKELAVKIASQGEFMPWWHYVPIFILNYTLGNYEQALYTTMRMRSRNNNFFYGPLFATATYAQLNMPSEAEESLRELLTLYPDFPSFGRRALNGIFFYEDTVEDFAKVLEDVGLRIS